MIAPLLLWAALVAVAWGGLRLARLLLPAFVAIYWAIPSEAFALEPYAPCPYPSASEPSSTCTYLVLPSAFQLSAEDGALLGGAILGVWAAAFGIRAAIHALRSGDGPESSE